MSTSLKALRDASPRNRPDFEGALEHYSELAADIASTPYDAPLQTRRAARRRPLLRIAAGTAGVAAALLAVIVTLFLGGASPQGAYAAARKALTATAAARSGTMTVTLTTADKRWTLYFTRWNGKRISMTSGAVRMLGPYRELRLIDASAYLQRANGSWVHYADQAGVGPKLGSAVQLAHNNVAGTMARQILRLATDLRETGGPHGTTLYTAVIPNSSADPANSVTSGAILQLITKLRSGNEQGAPGGSHPDTTLRMIVDHAGLVEQISLTTKQRQGVGAATSTWTVRYAHLGSTAPISVPTAAHSTP